MIQSKSMTYDKLPGYIQHMTTCDKGIMYHPELLLADDVCILMNFEPDKQHPLYTAATTILFSERHQMLLSAISFVSAGIRQTIGNQMLN